MKQDAPDDSFAALFEHSRAPSRQRTFHVGDSVQATVVRVSREAVFVELEGARSAFIEASEVTKPDGTVTVALGDKLATEVVEVDSKKGILRLGRVRGRLAAPSSVTRELGTTIESGVPGAPQAPIFVEGMTVRGSVVRIENYGVFLQIEGTRGSAGRGLLPVSELGVPRGTDLRKAFPEGTVLTAKVQGATGGKLRLSLQAAKDAEEHAQFDGFREKAEVSPTLGTFGDLWNKKSQR